MAQGDAQRLEQVASQALRFYERAFPMLASLFAEPALLARHRHRQGLAAVGAGPHRPNQLLAAYLRAERELGRIDASVDPEAAAMLLGACFQRAFLSAFSGQPIPPPSAHALRPAWSPASCPTGPNLRLGTPGAADRPSARRVSAAPLAGAAGSDAGFLPHRRAGVPRPLARHPHMKSITDTLIPILGVTRAASA